MQVEIQDYLHRYEAGIQAGLRDLRVLKVLYDEALRSGNFAGFSVVVIEFDGPLSMASAGLMTTDYDLDGTQLLDLEDLSSEAQGLSLAIDSTPDGGAVIFIWPSEWEAPRRFMDSLLRRDPPHLLALLPRLIFLKLENTYFSAEWWNCLSHGDKSVIGDLARSLGVDGMPDSVLTTESIVPWSHPRIQTMSL